jgi:DNA-binding CsgD family transcriptional regulator
MFKNLTESERTLLLFLADGMPTKDIAEQMNLTKEVVDHKVYNLRVKTGHKSRTKLITDYFKWIVNPIVIQSQIDELTAQINEYESKVNCLKFLKSGKINQLTVINQTQEIENATTDIT